MVGEIIKMVGVYCLGFTSGVIYTSNKFDRNPNEIFNGWKTDATNTGKKAVDGVKKGVETAKEKSAAKKAAKEEAKKQKEAEKPEVVAMNVAEPQEV